MSVQYTDLPRTITKRDGRQETFDPDKLERVLILAYRAVHPDSLVPASWVDSVLAAVLQQLQGVNELTVERCQDVVEDALMITGNHDIAKAYILYRNQRSQIREAKTVEAKIVADLVNVAASGNDEARENANVNADAPMGALLKIGETTLKSYALRSLFKPKHAQMHRDGVIHVHDMALSCLTINCLFIPLAKLLRHGFSTGHGFLRPPATIGSAATLTCIVIQSSQNDMLKQPLSL